MQKNDNFKLLVKGDEKMAEKKSFMLYYDYRQHLEILNNEQRGKLLMALFDFAELDELPDFNNDGMLKMAFSFMSSQIRRDNEKYEKMCQKQAENIKKRWEKNNIQNDTKNTTVLNGIPNDTKDTDTDTDTDTDKETETVTVTDTDTVTNTDTEIGRLVDEIRIRISLKNFPVDFQILFNEAVSSAVRFPTIRINGNDIDIRKFLEKLTKLNYETVKRVHDDMKKKSLSNPVMYLCSYLYQCEVIPEKRRSYDISQFDKRAINYSEIMKDIEKLG